MEAARHASKTRLVHVVLVVLLSALGAGCSGGSTSSPSQDAGTGGAANPSWAAGFIQDRPDQDTPNAQVIVTSTAKRSTVVRGLRLVWSGYAGRRWQPAEMPYGPGDTHRLDLRLIAPRCDGNADDAPAVSMRLDDGSTVDAPIDAEGTALLRQVWERMCGEQRLLEAVAVEFADGWRPVRLPSGPGLAGYVTALRGRARGPVELAEARGSVLLELEPRGAERTLLRAGQRAGRMPVAVTGAGRCDPHSLSQSSQTFRLRVWVAIGGGPQQSLVVVPDARARGQMNELIRRTCRLG
jgi:hypothetical protein